MSELRIDVSFEAARASNAIMESASIVATEMTRPSVLYHPILSRDGDSWCFLLGDNLQVGVAGFGDTPEKAADAFDKAWRTGEEKS